MSYPLEYGSYWFVYAYMMSGEHRIGIIQVVHLYLYFVLSLGIWFVLVCLCLYFMRDKISHYSNSTSIPLLCTISGNMVRIGLSMRMLHES